MGKRKSKPFVYYKIVFGDTKKKRMVKNLNTAFDKGVIRSFEYKSPGKTKAGKKIWEFKITQRKPRPKKKTRKRKKR